MPRFALIIFLALASSANSVSAQGKIDCGQEYKNFWEGLERDRFARLSAEQLAGISRMALYAYDACQAGDEREAKALFARIALWDGHPDQSTGPFNPNLPDR
jgi:hypothetical protein